jgi:hypothetical protein
MSEEQSTKVSQKKFSQFSRVTEGPVDVVGLKGGDNVIAKLTTDLVETNPDVTFRDAKGRFRSTDGLEDLTNQLKVNRFLANELDLINEALEVLGEKGYDDTEIWAAINELPVIVASDAPEIKKDGELWYDDDRLELFVSYQDGWISTTPLAARVEAGEALQAQILARVEAGEIKQAQIDEEKIAKKGDTMKGSLAMGGHQITGLGTPKQRGHTVSKGYMDDVLEDYATTAYVDEQVAGIESSGGGPTTKYDGNRFSVSGEATKALSSGDVMFLSGDMSTNNMLSVSGIALPHDDFNWDACAKAGVVKVKNGARVAAYFHVYDTQVHDGRNVTLLVKLLQPGADYEIEYETGAPCYFHGVFFG